MLSQESMENHHVPLHPFAKLIYNIYYLEIYTPPNRNMESNYSHLAIWPMLCIGVTTFYVHVFICSTIETAKLVLLSMLEWLTASISNF